MPTRVMPQRATWDAMLRLAIEMPMRSNESTRLFFETFDSAEKLQGHAVLGANRLTCAATCKKIARSCCACASMFGIERSGNPKVARSCCTGGKSFDLCRDVQEKLQGHAVLGANGVAVLARGLGEVQAPPAAVHFRARLGLPHLYYSLARSPARSLSLFPRRWSLKTKASRST